MKLKIIDVINGKTPLEEYVRLQVFEDVNLKGYAVVDRTFDQDNQLSDEYRHIFVFPKLEVKKGDFVRLYSKYAKAYAQQEVKSGAHRHIFSWGSDKCIWNNNGKDIASLIKYELVNSVPVPVPNDKTE